MTGVSESTIRRYQRNATAGDSLAPGRSPSGPRGIDPTDAEARRAELLRAPDASLAEHCASWVAAGQTAVSPATMIRALRRLGLPRNKRH